MGKDGVKKETICNPIKDRERRDIQNPWHNDVTNYHNDQSRRHKTEAIVESGTDVCTKQLSPECRS